MKRTRTEPRTVFLLGLACVLVFGCATTNPKDDPLKYTKKLAVEGHRSLYNNGAFKVPQTSITVIPAGPSAYEFAKELAGVRARQSFEESVKHAAESVYIVSEGTKLTFDVSKNISGGSNDAADRIRRFSRENSTLLVYRSTDLGKSIVGKSWDLSGRTFAARGEAGDAVVHRSRAVGDAIGAGGTAAGIGMATGSIKEAQDISEGSRKRSASALSYGGRSFVKGYVAVPSNVKQRAGDIGDRLSDGRFTNIISSENARRAAWSRKTVDLLTETAGNYTRDVSDSFSKAKQELNGSYRTTGLSFAIVKSLRWALQGLLWDATIEPVTKMAAASVGYISVNFLAFPSLVIAREGASVTEVALELTWDSARTAYDLVAPTATAALAGAYGVLDLTASHTAAGTTAVAGNVLGYAGAGLSKTAGVVIKSAGYAAGKTVEYIGVPLASAGIAVGGGTIGTAVGGVGAAAGGTLFVAGEAGAAGTQVFGNVIAGTALAGGTAASAAGGTAYGVYELSKAVVVPAGYELGSGIVLSYGTLSQLGAQSILAVSDCAYLVLSLEGPRWVLYAVKGRVDGGDDIAPGAAVDLKELQQAGEEIIYLPVSNEEMKNVVHSSYDTLPEIETGPGATADVQ